MKYCSSPTLSLSAITNLIGIFSFTSVICRGAAVRRDEGMRLKNRLFCCDFPWLIALRRLAVGVMNPTVNSSIWFDSLLLILTVPRCSLGRGEAEYGHRLTDGSLLQIADMQVVSYGSWAACITALLSVSSLGGLIEAREHIYSWQAQITL